MTETDEIRKELMDIDILVRMAEDIRKELTSGKIDKEEAKGKMDYIKSRLLKIAVHNEGLISRHKTKSRIMPPVE